MNSRIILVLSTICSMITAPAVPTLNNVVRKAAPRKVLDDVMPTIHFKEAPMHHPQYEPGLSYWSSPELAGKHIQEGSSGAADSFAMIEKSLSSDDLQKIDDFFNFEKDLDYSGLNIAGSGSSDDLSSGWDDIWNSPSLDDESNLKILHHEDSLTDSRQLDGYLNSENNGVPPRSKRPAEHANTPRPPKKPRVKKEPAKTISQGEIDYTYMQIQRIVQPMDRSGFESAIKQVSPQHTDIFDDNLNKVLDMFATRPEKIEGNIVNLPLQKDGEILNAIKTLSDSQKQIALAYAGSQARWRLSNQLLKSGISRFYLDHIMATMRLYH